MAAAAQHRQGRAVGAGRRRDLAPYHLRGGAAGRRAACQCRLSLRQGRVGDGRGSAAGVLLASRLGRPCLHHERLCQPQHRGPAERPGHGAAARHRQGDRRFHAQLRQREPGAGGPARPVPQPAGQRVGGHRRRHGDQDPAPQPGRGHRRHRRPDRQPGADQRGPAALGQGPRLPDRGTDHGHRRHPRRLADRAGLDPGPLQGPHRGEQPRRPAPGRDRAALPGLGRPPAHPHPRPGPRGPPQRHRRHRQRDQQGRHPPGHRVPPRRRPPGRPQPALQAHPAPGQLRRDHAGPGRRRAPGAQPGRHAVPLHRPPGHRGRPADPLRAAQGQGAGPHPRGPADRPRPPGRGHQPHPQRRVGRRGPVPS